MNNPSSHCIRNWLSIGSSDYQSRSIAGDRADKILPIVNAHSRNGNRIAHANTIRVPISIVGAPQGIDVERWIMCKLERTADGCWRDVHVHRVISGTHEKIQHFNTVVVDTADKG